MRSFFNDIYFHGAILAAILCGLPSALPIAAPAKPAASRGDAACHDARSTSCGGKCLDRFIERASR
jgi:hypothetical protein